MVFGRIRSSSRRQPVRNGSAYNLSDSDAANPGKVGSAMEDEASFWLRRYPVPVMVSAFNGAGDLIHLSPSNHLMGKTNNVGAIETRWGLLDSKELPPLSSDLLRSVYHDLPFRTAEEIRTAAEKELRRTKSAMRLSIWLLILWLVVVPVAIELLGMANPLVGTMVLGYSLWKAFVQLMKLLGRWPVGWHERGRLERERRMKHYFWHCERNPEGFQRLKIENFDREERARTAREVDELSKL